MVTILRAGTEVQVNTTTVSSQSEPSITTLINGDYVVTWTSLGQDGSFGGIFGQVFSPSGVAIGSEFQVNTTTANDQYQPFVRALSNGGFAVSWTSKNEPSLFSPSDVLLQRFDSLYQPDGSEVQVTNASTFESRSSFVELPDGRMVLTWTSVFSYGDSNGLGVFVQRYLADGSPEGLQTQVNTFANNNQTAPEIAVQSDGSYVVVWQSNYQDEPIVVVNGYVTSYGSQGIYAQRYDIDGNPLGTETRVNTTIAGDQISPKVVALNGGGYVITWRGNGSAGNGHYAQAYDQGGNPTGVESLIATIPNQAFDVSLTALSGGGYVVVFGQSTGIFAQRYDASGNAVGGPALVSGANGNSDISVAAIADDGFTVSWTSSTTGSGSAEIVTRTFTVNSDTDLLPGVDFADGSASADVFTVAAGGLNAGDFVKGLAGHDILNFTGGGVNTAVGAVLDSIEEIQLTNATGTTLTVNNVAQALLVTTATGAADALVVNSGSLTVAQRQTLYSAGVESLTDSQGTYTTSQILNAGVELSDGTNAADTFTVNAGGLNAGDKVYGADGHDILNFTGGGVNTAVGATLDSIEEIQLTNATGTTLTVNNVAQAMLVTTATGAADALILNSGTFTVAQRRALFDLGVESLSDAQGTYASTNAAPVTVADTAIGSEDSTLIVNVVQNDSDTDGNTITVVPGSIVVTGFTTSTGLVLPVNGGPVIDINSLQSHFAASGANIVFNPTVFGHSFQFLDNGQSITVTMTYNVTDGVSNVTQSTLTFTINGANEVLNLNEWADFLTQGGIDLRFGDNIYGNGGDDVIYSMSGNDFISGGTGDDQLNGGDGNDTVNGDDDDDVVWGGSGDDVIEGGNGDDHLLGGSGIDRLTGGTGGDVLDGGGGLDVASYINSLMAVNIDLGLGTASGGEAEDDTLIRIENLAGSAFDDTLAGSSQANRIFGHGGNDVLTGLDGNDVLNGMGGDDSVEGGAGGDTLIGGTGTDLLSYASSNVGVTVDLGSGLATGGHATGDVILMFENLAGSNFDDTLNGTVGDNSISGASGDDDMSGYGGNDILSGGDGYDVLKGNSGDDDLSGGVDDDSLYGGDGDDRLEGGDGNDQLYGGTGNDTFAFTTVQFGTDTVYGWVDGEDVIDLTGSGLTFASFTVTQVGSATHLTAGLDTIILTSTLASSIDVTDFVV